MRPLRLLVAPLCLATLGLVAKPANAQTGTLTVSNILWKDRPNKTLMSNTLNRDDCLANVKATVSAAVRNVSNSGLTFELWSGTGCDQQANRAATSVSRTCSKVKSLGTPVNQEIEIAFRDLIKPYGQDEPATEDVCELDVANGLISRTLYYIIIDSSFNSAITTTPSWSFKYDIKGPPPPTSVSAEAGDSSLVASFTPTPNEPNLLRYHFYCSEKGTSPVIANQEVGGSSTGGTGGTAGSDTGGTGGSDTSGTGGSTGGTAGSADTGDAGSGDTGGTSGSAGSGVVIDPNCQSATLIPGEDVPADAWECGSVGAVGAKGGETNPDLTNGDEYVVAVAAEDNVNNLGKLSNLACGTPKDARGFFENYRKAGGQAGGGYCSFAPPRHTGTAALLGLGALALVLRRRQK